MHPVQLRYKSVDRNMQDIDRIFIMAKKESESIMQTTLKVLCTQLRIKFT